MLINELYERIENRKQTMPQNSRVASLFRSGNDRIIQKVGEEAVEVVIAAKNDDKQRLKEEIADVWFHLLVLLSAFSLKPEEIEAVLRERMG
jgi:phosphoribosyl-ATP pyrophosphohydrolase